MGRSSTVAFRRSTEACLVERELEQHQPVGPVLVEAVAQPAAERLVRPLGPLRVHRRRDVVDCHPAAERRPLAPERLLRLAAAAAAAAAVAAGDRVHALDPARLVRRAPLDEVARVRARPVARAAAARPPLVEEARGGARGLPPGVRQQPRLSYFLNESRRHGGGGLLLRHRRAAHSTFDDGPGSTRAAPPRTRRRAARRARRA